MGTEDPPNRYRTIRLPDPLPVPAAATEQQQRTVAP